MSPGRPSVDEGQMLGGKLRLRLFSQARLLCPVGSELLNVAGTLTHPPTPDLSLLSCRLDITRAQWCEEWIKCTGCTEHHARLRGWTPSSSDPGRIPRDHLTFRNCYGNPSWGVNPPSSQLKGKEDSEWKKDFQLLCKNLCRSLPPSRRTGEHAGPLSPLQLCYGVFAAGRAALPGLGWPHRSSSWRRQSIGRKPDPQWPCSTTRRSHTGRTPHNRRGVACSPASLSM